MFKVITSARKHDLFLVEVATERMKGFELLIVFISARCKNQTNANSFQHLMENVPTPYKFPLLINNPTKSCRAK